MARETLLAIGDDGSRVRFVLNVFAEGEHWTSTLARLDANGRPETVSVAPRFYGTTAEQARRRMISVLENQYDQVESVGEA